MKATDRRRTVLQTPPLHCLHFSISRLSFLWHLLCKLLETARKTVLSTLLSPTADWAAFQVYDAPFLVFLCLFFCVLFAFSTATLMSWTWSGQLCSRAALQVRSQVQVRQLPIVNTICSAVWAGGARPLNALNQQKALTTVQRISLVKDDEKVR